MSLFKIIVQAPMNYVWGNFTYFSQLPLGLFCTTDGGCSAIDAVYCVNPVAKPFFILGAVTNIGAGCCMIGAFSLGYICVPAAFGVGAVGTALRNVGLYCITQANLLEPKPTLTKLGSAIRVVG